MTTQLRYLLFQSFDAAAIVAETDRLDAIFLKTFKKKLDVDLFFSSVGEVRRSLYGIMVYYTPEQQATLDFLLANVSPSKL